MSDYFDRVERQILRRVESGLPRSARTRPLLGHLATAAAVLVVIVVAGVFLLARAAGPTSPAGPAASANGVTVSLTPQPPLRGGAIARTIQILRARIGAAVPGARVSWTGGRIVIRAPHAGPAVRSQIEKLAGPGRLAFYDWEADVIGPNGKTVASQLARQNPTALAISQGSGTTAPGQPGAGSMSLDQVRGAAARLGAGTTLRAEYIGRLRLRVPLGYIVVGAARPPAGTPQFFLLKDEPVLTQSDIVNPHQGTDRNGRGADITFSFTAHGENTFRALTATIARRGALVSGLGQTLNQHFAVALDNRLITVPSVDFKQYPDGISGDDGADLSDMFTTQSAKNVAILLRYGPLPVDLTAVG